MKNENRLKLCLNYRLRGMSRASLIFLAIFVMVDLVLPGVFFALLGRRIFGPDGQPQINYGTMPVSYSFLLSAMIFLFVSAVGSFSEDFNFLLTLNNTRRSQFVSSLLVMLISGAWFFIASLLIHWLEGLVSVLINQGSLSEMVRALISEYNAANLAGSLANLLLTLVIFLGVYAFGLAAGILIYRFGRYFTVPFWICFGTSFFIIPLLIATSEPVRNAAAWFVGAGKPLPSLSLASHLGLTGLVLLIIGAMSIRKLQQN
jgi:hypothetical protein